MHQPIKIIINVHLFAMQIAHMTKAEMEYLDWSLLGPALLFLNQYFNCIVPEIWLLWFTLAWGTQDLLRYCAQVCLEICQHLRIDLFRIPHGPKLLNTISVGSQINFGVDKNGSTSHRKSKSKVHQKLYVASVSFKFIHIFQIVSVLAEVLNIFKINQTKFTVEMLKHNK